MIKKQLRAIQEHQSKIAKPQNAPWDNYTQKIKKIHLAEKKEKSGEEPRHQKNARKDIRLGIVDASDAASITSMIAHANKLTHVAVQDFSMPDVEGNLRIAQNNNTWSILKKKHLSHIAVLANYSEADDVWVPEAVEYLAFGPESHRKAFIRNLMQAVTATDAQGVLIDWQGIDPTYQDQLTTLLQEIGTALHGMGCELWFKVTVGDDLEAFDLSELSDSVDRFVASLHDENGQEDEPGPIASADWFSGWLTALLREMDPDQWIIELGTYGYDWSSSSKEAEEITFADAMTRARFSQAADVAVQSPDFNPTFAYSENEHDHTIWFLDVITFINQLTLTRQHGIHAIGINRLGTEDPKIWEVLEEEYPQKTNATFLKKLENIPVADKVTHLGQGEIVSAETGDLSEGRRHISFRKGVFTEQYLSFPKQPTLFHTGSTIPNSVALTFDDGPDPEWTPKILDILRAFNVHATFFVLGANAEKYPSLLQRIISEGHEIGSHTFTHGNLAEMSNHQISLELNATQRIIENATGRSTTLFRPPYDADAHLDYLPLLHPLQIIQNLGYIIVLEQIDPQDWSQPGAQEIFQRVKTQQPDGTILLLHDAGGNRQQTVQALPKILSFFNKNKIKIISISDILKIPDNVLMPRVSIQENLTFPNIASNFGFRILRFLSILVWLFIVAATVLIGIRTAIILILAFVHYRKQPVLKNFILPLSIIIPAYKEEKVIAATLRSLLKSDYASDFEIIVVDDGSPDQTSQEAQRIAMENHCIRVIHQSNQGKAAALENGIHQARYETIVFLDADTHFLPDTLKQLVAPLADPKVGAVAGHPRVGNPRTLIAQCQDIEYIVAFNLDRRALSLWNAVTVMPGAISVFRKQALADAGGFQRDTLAEDADLTLAMHQTTWQMECAPNAVALTEAPETVSALVKQRFRWTLGTMQSVWKHRHQTFSRQNPALGWFSLPGIWFFQILLVASAPFIDFLFLQAAIMGRWSVVLPYFSIFLISDLLLAFAACLMEPIKWTRAFWILPMRFIYRPILSYVVWKAVITALQGVWMGWGKLDRTGNVASVTHTNSTS